MIEAHKVSVTCCLAKVQQPAGNRFQLPGGKRFYFLRSLRQMSGQNSLTTKVSVSYPTCEPHTLAVSGIIVLRLADACEESVPGVQYIVERTPNHDPILLSRRERRNLVRVLQRQKVGQSKKEPVIRGAGGLALTVLP